MAKKSAKVAVKGKGKARGKAHAAPKTTRVAKSELSALHIGSKGTAITAPMLAKTLGIDGKRLRAWIRSADGVGNDAKYTRYLIHPDSAEGKAFIKRAAVRFRS